MRIILACLIVLICFQSNSQSSVQWIDSLHEKPHKFQRFTRQEWSETSLAKPESLNWFKEARFGMFVHLGVSSVSGVQLGWGKETRIAPDGGKGPLQDSIYDNQYRNFKLENFNPHELSALPIILPDSLDTVVVLEFDTSLNNIPTIKTSFQNIDQGDPKTHDLK